MSAVSPQLIPEPKEPYVHHRRPARTADRAATTAASWLWIIVLGGLTLWLSRQWQRSRGARRRARALLLPDLAAGTGVRRRAGLPPSVVW